jgi:hypothetical protein
MTLATVRDALAPLVELVATQEAVLFTGAGFSAGAFDQSGRALPRSVDMAAELWEMLFEREPPDSSTLPDLFDVASARGVDLSDYQQTRLTVDDSTIPGYYLPWFSAPWRRIYTLNVDDLEEAVARRFELPRPLRTIASQAELSWHRLEAIDVVHLNGSVRTLERATFSTSQYASRLVDPDPFYRQLCEDLTHHPFVFVGTVLDEPIFWKHLSLVCGKDLAARPSSVLVTRKVTRARQVILERLNIQWIAATVEEAADAFRRDARAAAATPTHSRSENRSATT